jgi:excinuclease ABC subunit C
MKISTHLQGILDTLPSKLGCHIMKNTDGTIIYIRRAINLQKWVRSYFHAVASHDGKTRLIDNHQNGLYHWLNND